MAREGCGRDGGGEGGGEGCEGSERDEGVHVGGAVARGSPCGGVDIRGGEEHGGKGERAEDPANELGGNVHQRHGHEWGEGVGERAEERVGAGGRGHHQRHGEQHSEGTGEEREDGAESEVRGLHAVVVVGGVGFACGGWERGIVPGVADGSDEGGGVEGRGGGDLGGVRHEVDTGRVDAGDGL